MLRDPAFITLQEVHRAVDEEHLLSMHHSQPNPECLIGRNIQRTLIVYFGEAERAFEQVLAGQTIAQVLKTASEDSSLRAR